MAKAATAEVVPFAEEMTPDLDACPELVEQIESLWGEIDQIMDDARDQAAPLRDEIKEYIVSIHDHTGFARRAIAATLASRRAKWRDSRRLAKLSDQHRDQAKRLKGALPEPAVQYTLDL